MMLLELFWTFFKIGAFTFGGGYAMIALIQSEVAARGWMSTEQLINFVAVSESTPGPLAVNMATFVGMQMNGFAGALVCTLGVVLPSFIVILIVAKCFEKFRKNRAVKGCMSGLKPAVVGLIASALVTLGKQVFFPGGIAVSVLMSKEFWISAAIFALIAFLAFKKKHPILLICISAVLGIAAGYIFNLSV